MTILEALAILESAVLECNKRDGNTPEMREALDFLERLIRPVWLIPQFRRNALDGFGHNDVDREGQQQVLRATSLAFVTASASYLKSEWTDSLLNFTKQKV